MKLPDLRSALKKRPFTPLRLHISGGRIIDIRQPELCVAGITSAFIGFPSSEDTDEPAYARYLIVDLDHIISLEPIETAAGANGN